MGPRTEDGGRSRYGIPSLLLIGICFALIACSSEAVGSDQLSVTSESPADNATQSPIPSITPSPLPTDTHTPVPTATATATPLPPTPTPCPPDVCTYPGHFLLARPISADFVDEIDPTYRYGSNQGGARKTHHGVEFVNSQGTPVLAAADGIVIVAGNDYQTPYADFPVFYGNLVIIEHELPGIADPVFTVYGHLFEVQAEAGQRVSAGDPIGLVGFTGAAIGEHLHFEVRYGENSYRATRNPELWLQPHSDGNGQPHGVIAGKILDEFGSPIPIPSITIEQLSDDGRQTLATYYVDSYADWTVNGDEALSENFVIADLPAGKYRLSFVARGLQTYEVDVLPGMITLITFDARELEG